MHTRYKAPGPIGDSLLAGAKEIGAFIGLSPRATYYLAQQGRIPPVFRIGGRRIYAQKDALHAWLMEQMRSGQSVGDTSSGSITTTV